MTKDEALRIALEALESVLANHKGAPVLPWIEAKDAIKAALEAKVEPVAWRTFDGEGGYDYHTYEYNEDYAVKWDANNPKHKGWVEPLYTTPPQRTWVGLTTEEKSGQRPFDNGLLFNSAEAQVWELAVDYAEAKLKEKNT